MEISSPASLQINNFNPTAGRYRRFRTHPVAQPPSDYGPQVTAVVTCKGRLSHLHRTLPLVLAQDYYGPLAVAVIDYGDPDGCFEWCAALRHQRLSSVRILDNTQRFNLSRARNCGANLLPAELYWFVDADSLVPTRFLQHTVPLLQPPGALLARRNFRDRNTDTCGLCLVRAREFHLCRGYDEQFEGWGPEDSDFYARVRLRGPTACFPPWLYPATIRHSNALRTRFYSQRDISASAADGCRRLLQPDRVVNPTGYGRAKALVQCADTNHSDVKAIDITEPIDAGIRPQATDQRGLR